MTHCLWLQGAGLLLWPPRMQAELGMKQLHRAAVTQLRIVAKLHTKAESAVLGGVPAISAAVAGLCSAQLAADIVVLQAVKAATASASAK